jgi:hypothetical protein
MLLPGGLMRGGARRREYAFRPVTGAVEMALVEIVAADMTLPKRVTAALAIALAEVGGEEPRPETVAGLAVADRQYLMAMLAVELGREQLWYIAECRGCGQRFDFSLRFLDLPVKEAGEGYPFAEVATSLGSYRFRVATGSDQELLAAQVDAGDSLRLLVAGCMVAAPEGGGKIDSSHQWAQALTDDDINRIETALEAVAPEMAVAVQTVCPGCGNHQTIEIDPYGVFVSLSGTDLLHEVHLLASTYHWSERDILELSHKRRRRYLELIDQDQGLVR